MANFMVVGAAKVGAGFSPVKYDIETGDLVLFDDVMGSILLSEITLPGQPHCDVNDASLLKMAEQYGGIGTILFDGGFIILGEETAKFYKYSDLLAAYQEISYSLDEEYEE